MIKKQAINEVYVIRALAIIGVLMVHSTSNPATLLSKESIVFPVYNFTNIFFKFGTPTFIFLSSFVLFYNYFERDVNKRLIGKFYKKRLTYIIIPYVLFSIFYYVLLLVGYYSDRSLSDAIMIFIKELVSGSAYTHLYFVFISVQFYILFPFLLILFKKFTTLNKYLIVIGLLIQWGFVLINKYYIEFPYKGSISLSYFSYYLLGAYMGIYFEKIKGWFIVSKETFTMQVGVFWALLWSLWLTLSFSHVSLWFTTRVTGVWRDSLWYELLWNLHTYFSALILFQLGFFIYRYAQPRIVNILIHLGIVSFGFYLIHPFILLLHRQIQLYSIPVLYHLWTIGGFFITLGLSWLIVGFAMKHIKAAWILFGSFPKQIPYLPVRNVKKINSENTSSKNFQA